MESKGKHLSKEDETHINQLVDSMIDKELSELELEKKEAKEEIERQKRYLIEDVLDMGDTFVNEMEKRPDVKLNYSPPKKSLFKQLIEFVFG